MIDLYVFATSTGLRVPIMLEECGLAYRVHRVDLRNGEQQRPEFLALNPAGAIPVIVDADGPGGEPLTLAQSGAILVYLAEKSGRFLPVDPARRYAALQWLAFATADVTGASGGLLAMSTFVPEKSAASIGWFEQRLTRYFRIADQRLAERDWLAGELSVADLALYPLYVVRKPYAHAGGDVPNLARWAAALAARPGVAKGMAALD